jgi:2-succinyl-5-enolpyruvyl-6-hydroxy-3-cyclohexene-1-carboxylate synthase
VALMGDLTLLHDSNGLALGPDEPRPDLTIVVANDDGGGIFATLEYGEPERAADFERIFGTPTGTGFAALCQAHGIPHTVAESPEDLAAELASAATGIRVVEVAVDRSGHRELRARLAQTAAASVR